MKNLYFILGYSYNEKGYVLEIWETKPRHIEIQEFSFSKWKENEANKTLIFQNGKFEKGKMFQWLLYCASTLPTCLAKEVTQFAMDNIDEFIF